MTEHIHEMLESVWAHAMPGREAVAQNELLRELHMLMTEEKRRPLHSPRPDHLRLAHWG
jgi:hypothetical protein